jgi:carbamoyl-phosphate synthase large subunit
MKNLNILLLGAGNRVSLCEWLIKAGKLYRRKVNIFSLEVEEHVPIIKYAEIIKGLKWSDPCFEQQLSDTISDKKINIVLPLMDAATVALANCKHFIEESLSTPKHKVWCVVSRHALCKTFENKILSDSWFRKNNILVPALYPETFPVIAKLINGYGSRNQKIFKYSDELKSYENLFDGDMFRAVYMLQEFISGVEYTVDAYVSTEGKVISIVPRIRLAVVNGEVSKSVTKREQELIQLVENILTKSEAKNRFEGPITLQFIKSNIDGKWYMVEINPRFGGGVICSFGAGANLAEVLIAEYLDLPTPDCSWEEGVLMMRCNQEVWSTMEI